MGGRQPQRGGLRRATRSHRHRTRGVARGGCDLSSRTITLCDVGPRDGLQNDPAIVAPAKRAELANRLAAAGMPRVEAASFVSPARVPQMAGAEEVVAKLDPDPSVVYAGLVLNERGYDRLATTRLGEAHFAFAVTETFNRRNQGATVADSIATAASVVARAHADGRRATVTIGASFGCPFEGRVDAGRVLEVAAEVVAEGPDEILFADTIGVGVPSQVRRLVGDALAFGIPVGVHFHNTRNTGYANAYAALEAGAVLLDASVGGIGGCPFAPHATGNIASEDLVYLLHGEGVETGVDLDALVRVAEWLEGVLGRPLEGQVYRSKASSRLSERNSSEDRSGSCSPHSAGPAR